MKVNDKQFEAKYRSSGVLFNVNIMTYLSVPVAARSKASVCGRSLAEIVGSNPPGGMDVCLL